MCGIAGIFGIEGQAVHRNELELMCNALISRGPDEEGYYVGNDIGLGMRRLSIIDVGGGQQPITNEDGTIKVVLNGEIYNFQSLRRDLELQGHRFRTSSDTEVIVHLYEQYGIACVEKLRGMFAFALWDENRKQLMLARDRLGIKPLYFGEFDGRLLFASELKSLLTLSCVKRELNWSSVSHLFAFLSTSRDESIVQGVHKLEPGQLLTVKAGQVPVIQRYWDVRFEANHRRSEGETIEQLRALLEESVKLCMISDVPLGAFLSGGVDSSAVVATMARLSDRPVKTFSIGFKDKTFDESRYARELAQKMGTEHYELILDPDVSSILEDLSWHLDEPLGDSSAIPTYMVSKLAATQVKVVLSGDGGDELFAGYDRYMVEQKERSYRHIPSVLRGMCGMVGNCMPEGMKGRRFLRHLALNGNDRYVDAYTMFGREEQHALFRKSITTHMRSQDPWREMAQCLGSQTDHWLSALQYADLKNYLPLDVLTKVDRMSSAHSIEARVPLLDHKLVEFAATIPASMKLRDGTTKHIFKQALRGILPDATLDRRKQGFAMPLGAWFRGQPDYVRDLLLSGRSRARGIFNASYIEKLLSIHHTGRCMDLELWTLISFELWCRRYLDNPATFAVRKTVRAAGSAFSSAAVSL